MIVIEWPPRLAAVTPKLPDYPLVGVGQVGDPVEFEDGTGIEFEDGAPLTW